MSDSRESTFRRAKVVLLISGMRENACRVKVEEALSRIAGVIDVGVSLMRAGGVVEYQTPCTEGELLRAVERAGFTATVSKEYAA